MLMHRCWSNSKRSAWNAPKVSRAFSLLELVSTIAIVGVLAAVIVNMSVGTTATVKNTKLQSDVVLLNQLVGLYLNDGGSLTGASTPQAVLDRMKKTRTVTDAKQHIGPGTGRFVDIRLKARMGSGQLTDGIDARATWNVSQNRFELSSGSASGVEEFYLDEALASTDYGTETRKAGGMKFNSSASSSNGWVWGSTSTSSITTKSPTYVDPAGSETYFDPTEAAPLTASGSGSGSASGSGSGSASGSGSGSASGSGSGSASGSGSGSASGSGSGSGGSPPVVLPTPIISPAGGTFTYASFPTAVSINNNGAPGGQSKIEYQLNGGAWQDYSSTITIASGDSINARNKSLNTAAFSDSPSAAGSYYQLVSDFSGGGVGSWGNVQGGSNLVQATTNGDPTSTLTHGNTKLDIGGGVFLDAGVANELTFTKTDFTGAAPNTWFQLGTTSILNGTTFYDSESSGATLTVNLNLTQPSTTGVVHVDLGFTSTENNGSALENADIVELKSPTTDFTTTIGGVTYRLELSWVTLDPGSGVVQGNQFLIYEGATATAQLNARFVSDH